MRSEKEMMALIVRTAEDDERIRAVCLRGSRANPNITRDIFQDYDIDYIVKETESFQEDASWIDRFGDRLYMQYPENSVFNQSDVKNCYGWLIQFRDGIRLDLHVSTLQHALEDLVDTGPYTVLLDKDGCLPKNDMVSHESFWVKMPSEAEFRCACNEFWWCTNSAAKGLWREEITYAMDILNSCMRPMLMRLLEWRIGTKTDFTVSVGKSGKYMHRWLSPGLWRRVLTTYPRADSSEIWESVFIMWTWLTRLQRR